jgi:hypothetical protein
MQESIVAKSLGDPGGFNNVDITKEEKGDEVDHTIEH